MFKYILLICLIGSSIFWWLTKDIKAASICLVMTMIVTTIVADLMQVHFDLRRERARLRSLKPCTCLGSCKGKEGLGKGWICSLDLSDLDDSHGGHDR